ncbi:hypothetical protein ACIP93_29670 [Streptomyces sp. NPDC088745]|uniref:hypothetical protein n=1 Tax=Streptomyces sp. NPDC088745 TaxID=3365884 RepID=UPI00381460E8
MEDEEAPVRVRVPRGYSWRTRDWEEHVETDLETAAEWDDRAWAAAGALWRSDDVVRRWTRGGTGWDL